MSGPPKIMVVDPNPDGARITANLCMSAGFEAVQTGRIESAIHTYQKEQPDVVLAEVEFPDGTGLELIKKLREVEQGKIKAKILIHTQIRGSVEVVRKAAIEAGAEGVLPKPLNLQNLSHFVPFPYLQKPQELQPELEVFEHIGESASISLGQDTLTGKPVTGVQPIPADGNGISEPRPAKGQSGAVVFGLTKDQEGQAEIETQRGELAKLEILNLLSESARDGISRSIHVETHRGSWCEFVCHNGTVCDVHARGIGPDIVDVALREGIIDSSNGLRLRLDLLEKGERLAQRILGRAGVDNDDIVRVLELTAKERIIAAGELSEGTITVVRGARPRFVGLPIALPLPMVISDIVDRIYPVHRIPELYVGREREPVRKTDRFGEISPDWFSDEFTRNALVGFPDSDTILDWIERNRADSGRFFVFLFKLEQCGAVMVGTGTVQTTVLSFTRDVETEFGATPSDTQLDSDVTTGRTPKTRYAAISKVEGSSRKRVEPPPASLGLGRHEAILADADMPREAERSVRDIPTLTIEPQPDQVGPYSRVPQPGPGGGTEDTDSEGYPMVDEALEMLLQSYIEDTPSPIPGDEREGIKRVTRIGPEVEELRPSVEGSAKVAPGITRHRDFQTSSVSPGVESELERRFTPMSGTQAIEKEKKERPRLDELGNEACDIWLRTMGPIIQQNGGSSVPTELLSHLSGSTSPRAGSPMERFILGLVAISEKNLDLAHTHLNQALQGAPKDRWINAALALLQSGYYSQPTIDLSVEGVWKTIRNVVTQKGSGTR